MDDAPRVAWLTRGKSKAAQRMQQLHARHLEQLKVLERKRPILQRPILQQTKSVNDHPHPTCEA